MKIFLINLDKDTEKLEVAARQLRVLDIDYERVPGTYGKGLQKARLEAAYSSFRWWCAIGRPITVAEIGCALSHYSIYKRMIAEDIPYAFIFEDDVVVSAQFNQVLTSVEGWLDKDIPQVVLFSNHGNLDFSSLSPVHTCHGGEIEIYQTETGICTEAYCLTLAAVKALLKQNLPMITPCDHWGRWVKNGAIKLYHAVPTTCSQNQAEFGSSTSQGRGRAVADYPMWKWVLHKGKRLVGKSMDVVLTLVTRR